MHSACYEYIFQSCRSLCIVLKIIEILTQKHFDVNNFTVIRIQILSTHMMFLHLAILRKHFYILRKKLGIFFLSPPLFLTLYLSLSLSIYPSKSIDPTRFAVNSGTKCASYVSMLSTCSMIMFFSSPDEISFNTNILIKSLVRLIPPIFSIVLTFLSLKKI